MKILKIVIVTLCMYFTGSFIPPIGTVNARDTMQTRQSDQTPILKKLDDIIWHLERIEHNIP